MLKSDCLCQKNSSFRPQIVYKNETVFKNFNGTIIGRCQNCGLLKTVVQKKNKFNPQTTHVDFYEEKRFLFINLFQPIVDQIKKYRNKGLVLDVGCSSGIMLGLLKKEGYDFFGIEPNKKAYLVAQKKFKNKIFNGCLKDFVKTNKTKFDIVIYNHVFEHIENLNFEIDLIKKVLKSKGLLFVGSPNSDNIIFCLRQKFWEYLVPLEHYWHFSKNYLVEWLQKKNFQTVDISFSDDPRSDYPVLKQIYFRFLSVINKFFATGELMLVITQKND